ncbi:unnamed protein product, partial [Larinioides sclopetarius]
FTYIKDLLLLTRKAIKSPEPFRILKILNKSENINLTMEYHAYFNWSLLVAVSLVCHALADDSAETNRKFLENLGCIFKSGDQYWCNYYLENCNNELPDTFKQAYDECVKELFPNGIGECTSTQEMYESDEKRKQLNDCIGEKVGSYQVSGSDEKRLDYVNRCAATIAKKLGCRASK